MALLKQILFLILSLLLTGNATAESVRLKFGGTEICVPVNYVPELSFVEKVLEYYGGGYDSSEGSEIILLPPELIKEHVPEYILSHINKHNVDLKHEISGIAYRLSNDSRPNGLALKAWNVYQNDDNPLVMKEESGYYRIYPWGFESFSWYQAKGAPPKDSGKEMPSDWFVGYCNNDLDNCYQSIIHKDVLYSYKIHLLDIEQREEVANAIRNLFSDWEEACDSTK